MVAIVKVVPGQVRVKPRDVINLTRGALLGPPLALSSWQIGDLNDGRILVVHDLF